MTTRFFKRSLFARLIVFIIIANFILTTVPISAYSSSVFASDSLRQSATLKTENPGRGHLLDDLNADLHARAQATVARLPDGGKVGFHKYDKKKGGYVVEPIDKKRLTKLLSRDEIGLIEDEDNPGQYIWAQRPTALLLLKGANYLSQPVLLILLCKMCLSIRLICHDTQRFFPWLIGFLRHI